MELRLAFFCSVAGCVTCVMILLFKTETYYDIQYPADVMFFTERNVEDFLVKSESCVIPMIYPYGPTVKQHVKVTKHHKCPNTIALTYKVGFNIIINTTAVPLFKNFTRCVYTPFVKRKGSDKSLDVLKKRSVNFTKQIQAKDEFVIVQCYNSSQISIHRKTYAFFFRNKTLDVIMKERYTVPGLKHRTMNVLLFGFESTSRMNFLRHMNLTRDFILKELDGVEMLGFNKMGSNTFPNKVGAFLGIPEAEMNYDGKFLDKYQFIWKNFSNAGYRTFYTEDDLGIATFHYLKSGFLTPPVDHYLRTYMMATEIKGYCSGNTSIPDLVLDNVFEFVKTYRDVPHYSDIFLSQPTHDNPNGLGIEDIPYLNHLKKLVKNNYLNNTMLMFYGDHGSRYGRIRNTFQGRLEEHLPALYFVFPPWFREEQSTLFQNLRHNANKLISNFDIFQTFLHIIDIGKGFKEQKTFGKYGKSLLQNISNNRSCDDLKIPQGFCACANFSKVDNFSDPIIKNAAQWIFDEINSLLMNSTKKCIKLKLMKIIKCQKTSVSEEFIKAKDHRIIDYIVTTRASKPSYALLESAVRYDLDQKKFKKLSPIQRLDEYAGQSRCVSKEPNGRQLERYCYCKDLL